MTHVSDIALADQIQAAEADLARIVARSAPHLGLTETAEPAPWLEARLDRFADDVLSGAVHLCTHLEHATGPRPAFGVLGDDPGRLACTRCARTLMPADLTTPITCDRCGAATEYASVALAELGTAAVLILLCDTCASDDA